MNDAILSQHGETACDVARCTAGCAQWKAAIIATFQRLVEVNAERLEHYARVTTKLELIQHTNDVT